jgi:hypothetical protein
LSEVFFIQPAALFDKLLTEIAYVSDRASERRQAELEEDKSDLEDAPH